MTEIEVKGAVRARDGYRCTACGMTDDQSRDRWGKGLEVHRVIPRSPYTVEGCVTLCKCCHARAPRGPRRPQRATKTQRLDIRLGVDLVRRIKRQAERFGITTSAYVSWAATRALEQEEAADAEGAVPA